MITQKELLDNANALDRQAAQKQVRFGKAILSVPTDNPVEVPQPHELSLVPDEEDPFSGNINNRNVAKRIAAQKSRVYANPHRVIHTGDPDKAMKDIAMSEKLNPESLSEQEMAQFADAETLRNLSKVRPSADSPAAKRAADDQAKARENAATSVPERQTPGPQDAAQQSFAASASVPAPWKPNAGAVKGAK